jgi:hypothetical protein
VAGSVDLGPAELNVRSLRGDTIALPFTITEAGQPIDITDRTYAAKIRKVGAKNATVITFTVDVTDAETGQIILRMAETVTANLGGSYSWDLQQTDEGAVRTLVAGEWTFDADVSR